MRMHPSRLILAICLIPRAACAAETTAIRFLAVVDGAAFAPGLPTFGSLGTVFCTGLTGIDGVQVAKQYPLPSEIAGVSVRVHNYPEPLLAVANFGTYQQINFQGWQGLRADPFIRVTQGGITGVLELPTHHPWGVFFTDVNGVAVAQHADYSLVTAEHPAQPGEVLIVYCTNLEAFAYIYNAPRAGMPAGADPLPSIVPSSSKRSAAYVTVNGGAAEMFYSGLTPGLVGVFQFNFRVPANTPGGKRFSTR